MLRNLSLVLLVLIALTAVGCNGCGTPTMTLSSPVAFGSQVPGTPTRTINVPMESPQVFRQAAPSCATPNAAPRYVPVR